MAKTRTVLIHFSKLRQIFNSLEDIQVRRETIHRKNKRPRFRGQGMTRRIHARVQHTSQKHQLLGASSCPVGSKSLIFFGILGFGVPGKFVA